MKARIWTVARTERGNVVLLRIKDKKRVIPIIVHHLEAQSILVGLSNVSFMRPLTHDLFISLVKQLTMKIVRVEITDIQDNTFYSRIVLANKKHKRITLDSRPSDALSIATRCKCPLYVSKKIIDVAAIDIKSITGTVISEDADADTDEDSEKTSHQWAADQLKLELQKALEEENYEEAARIRDKIQHMKEE